MRVNFAFGDNSIGSSANLPIRIFGPERSCKIGILTSRLAWILFSDGRWFVRDRHVSRVRTKSLRCSFLTQSVNVNISGELLAGPIVQTIFVRFRCILYFLCWLLGVSEKCTVVDILSGLITPIKRKRCKIGSFNSHILLSESGFTG